MKVLKFGLLPLLGLWRFRIDRTIPFFSNFSIIWFVHLLGFSSTPLLSFWGKGCMSTLKRVNQRSQDEMIDYLMELLVRRGPGPALY